MSSLAQEESRSISENTTWGKRKMFADGKASVAYSRFLGYDRGDEKGEFVINEEEAKTVREIYRLFIAGYSFQAICTELETEGMKPPGGGDKRWPGTVKSVIENEKYKGDCLLQKYYTDDFLSKKIIKNSGEIPQYYVEGHHDGIVSAKTFDEAQAELKRRQGCGRRWSGVSIFSSRIVCEECGSFYGSKVWHSKDKCRRVIWRCNHKYSDKKKHCGTHHLDESRIKELFVKAVGILWNDKDVFISNMEELRAIGDAPDDLQTRVDEISSEMEVLAEKTRKLIEKNAREAMDQAEYEKKYTQLISRYERKEQELQEVTSTLAAARAKDEAVAAFIQRLRGMEGSCEKFDENLWGGLVDTMTVHQDGSATFLFKGGAEIDVK